VCGLNELRLVVAQAPNKQMQRARTEHKVVLDDAARR
jgi:hypothetical protein